VNTPVIDYPMVTGDGLLEGPKKCWEMWLWTDCGKHVRGRFSRTWRGFHRPEPNKMTRAWLQAHHPSRSGRGCFILMELADDEPSQKRRSGFHLSVGTWAKKP